MSETLGLGVAPAADDVIGLLRWLIRQDTTTGTAGEREALSRLADHARRIIGTAGEVRVAGDRDAFVIVPIGAGAPVLLFACHIDTVPVGDAARWRHAPWAGVVEDGVVHGRGASDMKSGLATALLAVVEGIAAGARVALAVTTGEEAGCLGAPAAAKLLSTVPIGAVIIPESTDNSVALGHRGAYWLTVEKRGVAAHGSTPDAGVNAVLALAEVLTHLEDLPLRSHDSLGAESVNVGVLSGGEVHNIVPAHASAAIDHRVVDADVDALSAWWSERGDAVSEDLRLDPVWTDAGDAWVQSLPAPRAGAPVPYFTDASVLVRHLPPRTPIVVWGPGDPTTVHTADESVAVAMVENSLEMFRVVIARWGDVAASDPFHPSEGARS